MPKKNTRLSESPDSGYEKFLRSVEPVGLGLSSSLSRLDREVLIRIRKQRGGATRSISTEYKLTDAADGYFDATGKFVLTVTDGKQSSPALVIECKYESHFHCHAPVNKEFAERFTTSELRLVLWPYFRELVHDLCGKMGIPPLTIPIGTS
jgi:hypothetical protein